MRFDHQRVPRRHRHLHAHGHIACALGTAPAHGGKEPSQICFGGPHQQRDQRIVEEAPHGIDHRDFDSLRSERMN